jgi:hypothetical protein
MRRDALLFIALGAAVVLVSLSFPIAALDVLGGLCLALGSLLLVMGRNPLPFGRRAWSPVGARFDGVAMVVLGIVNGGVPAWLAFGLVGLVALFLLVRFLSRR